MKVPNAISGTIGKISLKANSASPQVLFAVGIVGVGATVVLACRATLKVEAVLNEHDQELDAVHIGGQTNTVSDRDIKKQTARVYVGTSLNLGKLYAPAVICGVLSVGALAGSHNILSKRNAGLTAAYSALDKAYKGYRDRVRQELGEEREREIYNDVQVCEIEDPETGKKIKKAVTAGTGAYQFFFGTNNKNFERLPESNVMFLKMQQIYMNQKLQARGHLFLNEVLDALGFEHTTAGAVTGWKRDEGDGFVDFGIFNKDYEESEKFFDFITGREDGIWLNFNVDGPIYKSI